MNELVEVIVGIIHRGGRLIIMRMKYTSNKSFHRVNYPENKCLFDRIRVTPNLEIGRRSIVAL